MFRVLIAVGAVLLLAACGGGVCTQVLVWAVNVRVIDARTDAGICDAGVVVSEGAFSERLEARGPAPTESSSSIPIS